MKKVNELIKLPEVKTIFNLFNNNQGIYLVGGCIRDTLSAKEVTDIDFAIDIDPEEVVKTLSNNNIKFYDIGINYGTVTAVIDSKNYEITSLREDIETDGRHAKVKYTSDIKADSLRRDFTINAIYANRDGELFDFHNGIDDIENRNLKFIGSANDRVKEDYLRILRYFRFYADFSNFEIDANLKKVFKEGSKNFSKISKERIWTELKKIINQNNSFKSLSMMNEANILTVISKDIAVTDDYKRNSHIEDNTNKPIDYLLKLSILLENSEYKYDNFWKPLGPRFFHARGAKSANLDESRRGWAECVGLLGRILRRGKIFVQTPRIFESGTWSKKMDLEGQEDLDRMIQHAVPSWAAD